MAKFYASDATVSQYLHNYRGRDLILCLTNSFVRLNILLIHHSID